MKRKKKGSIAAIENSFPNFLLCGLAKILESKVAGSPLFSRRTAEYAVHRERQRRKVSKRELTSNLQILTDANDARNRNKKIEREIEKENEKESENEKEKEKESSSQAAEGNSGWPEFGSAAWQRNFIAFFNRCVEGSNIPRMQMIQMYLL